MATVKAFPVAPHCLHFVKNSTAFCIEFCLSLQLRSVQEGHLVLVEEQHQLKESQTAKGTELPTAHQSVILPVDQLDDLRLRNTQNEVNVQLVDAVLTQNQQVHGLQQLPEMILTEQEIERERNAS